MRSVAARFGGFFFFFALMSTHAVRAEEGIPAPIATASPSPTPSPTASQSALAGTSTLTGATASVVKWKSSDPGIQGLTLKIQGIPVALVEDKKSIRTYVTLIGAYNRPGWTLYAGKDLILASQRSSDRFSYIAFLSYRRSGLVLTAVSPTGVIETSRLVVVTSTVKNFAIIQPGQKSSISVSLGGASLSLFQTGYGNFSSTNIWIGVDYLSPRSASRWGFAGGFDGTVAALTTTATGQSPQFLNGRANATYLLTPGSDRFTSHLLGGIGYLTMLSNGCPCGFTNLLTTEFGLRATWVIGPLDTLGFRMHYIALGSGLGGLLSFKEKYIDPTLSWSRKIQGLHSAELGLRLSDLNYFPIESTNIHLKVLSLSLSYSI